MTGTHPAPVAAGRSVVVTLPTSSTGDWLSSGEASDTEERFPDFTTPHYGTTMIR